jgi:putative transposase
MDHRQRLPLRVFDPGEDIAIVERKLPHWSQAGTLCFITWRTDDSMPAPVMRRWQRERREILQNFGIDSYAPNWRLELSRLAADRRQQVHRQLASRFDHHLDCGHGPCVLKREEFASIVADSLHHFDGQRYELTDFTIMPNHVHLLAAFVDEESMLAQCESWKHYTAVQINRILGRKGRFWQQDGFDHLARSVDQFEALREYIAGNPMKARLQPGQFMHYQKEL